MIGLLKNPAYLKLWVAQVVSELGDGITHIVVIFLVSQLSDNALVFSFVLMARYIPSLLFGVFVGPIIDRYSKKVIMVIADLYRLIILLLMIPAHDSLTGILVLIFLQGIGTVFFEPAKTATIPQIIKKEKIPEAVGLSQSTFMTMNIIAPSIGGALLLVNSVSLIFVLDASTFLISALLIGMIVIKRETSEEHTSEKGYIASMKEGLSAMKNDRFLKGFTWLLVVSAFVMSVVGANMYHIILNVFEIKEFQFGLLESTEGVFGVLGALLIPFIMKRVRSNRLILVTLGFSGLICTTILPVSLLLETYPITPIFIWMSFLGLSNPFINVPLNSLFMQSVDETILGRVGGIINAILHASLLGGLLIGGWIGTVMGGIPTVVGGGILLLLVSLIFPLTKHYKDLEVKQPQEERATA
ncbi:MFS transporter [Guptibacillus algicola]|uniref:MFS transporter n=1 Tax=Guptibacillus algicola TaxID=225844 RepID=UPI001CD1F65B|nr:MFS transporter [Alkalihalobacillus algicola]MCA0988579.1 MFS transporter [Alkalihalobacillus algicola]